MNRTTTITLAALLVAAAVAVPLAAASVVSNGTAQSDADAAGNDSIEPGAQFAAAVGVQNADVGGELSERTYSVRIANAETNETKAAIVDDQLAATSARLERLEARLESLNESRAAGELGEDRYRAEVATTVARIGAVERQAAALERTAAELPERALADRGVDLESIRSLRDRAGGLGGPETAAIARSVAGDDVGRSFGSDREPGDPVAGENRRGGPAASAENGTATGSSSGGTESDSTAE
ncbi:hypothetical protein [Natrinema marinum]|uniref:hypothetical protein n=1 Tax=Natrinema marinum TaxID=2961598 RepID=UPI0020C90E89|nr:hypothetical protein [Natrinema marinum]